MPRSALLALLLPLCALAQIAPPNEAGVSFGHVHVITQNIEAQRAFWTLLGATPGKPAGPNEVFIVKGAKVLIRKQDSSGGSEASTVHHIGFAVAGFDAVLAKAKAAGYPILSTPESIAKYHKANVMAPDNVNVELVANDKLDAPIAFHHVHFYNSPIAETKAWYVKTFGAAPGKRDAFEAADVPGANLSFSASKSTPAPTKGRVLDHIGFEVRNLKEFCDKLEAAGVKFDQRYTKGPNAKVAIAYIFDPWGTYIELTEGL